MAVADPFPLAANCRVDARIGPERQRVVVAGRLKMFARGGEIGLRQQTLAPAELQSGVLRVLFCRLLKQLRGRGKVALPFLLTSFGIESVKLRAAGRRQMAVRARSERRTVLEVHCDGVQQNFCAGTEAGAHNVIEISLEI